MDKTWAHKVRTELKLPVDSSLTWKSIEGFSQDYLYTAAHINHLSEALPGEPPYTRGVYASMYQGKLWTLRQYAGFSSAQAFFLNLVHILKIPLFL